MFGAGAAGRRSMKAIVDSDICTGCGECADICPEVFEMVKAISRVKVTPAPAAEEETCRAAANACPVEAVTIQD
jgi:ferredoxin